MSDNFSIAFRNTTLRHHRRKILFDREVAMLPAMQIFVEAKRNMRRIEILHREQEIIYEAKCAINYEKQRKCYEYEHAVYAPLLTVYTPLVEKKKKGEITPEERVLYRNTKIELAKAKIQHNLLQDDYSEYHRTEYVPARNHRQDVMRELQYWSRMYTYGQADKAEKVKREFLMRCPGEDCRGFLSTAYKCGVCEKNTCSECLEILGEAEHTCKPENVESAKAIKSETRPCPKCAARIYKIDGCDQMWCTVDGCGTAFSWNTGQVVSGRVHNPHYYEWLRRNGGGAAPREAGDIPCGGIPGYNFTRYIIRALDLTTDEKNFILEMHRNIVEFEHRLLQYPAQPPAMMNKEINVRYLMNEMQEDDWKSNLEYAEAAFNRKKIIGQLLQTLVMAAGDILQGIVARFEDVSSTDFARAHFIRETAVPNLESLRQYTNESYLKIGKTNRMAVPQINDRWQWTGVRIHYKPARGPPPLDMAVEAPAEAQAQA